jgi:rhodanese-related sulfurtransferase
MAIQNISGKEFKKMFDEINDKLEIIDVREREEYDEIRIKGSKLIPLSEFSRREAEIDWSKKVIFVCRSGNRSGFVAARLANIGHEVMNLAQGIFELDMDKCECLDRNHLRIVESS